jgi:two-component system response regulator FlrC
MPLSLQAKLLRVLQEREVERVGGRKPIPLDIRVLATSNRDMLAEVKAGRFREDLYYRLNVFPLHMPALRERPDDLLPLARHFIGRHGAAMGCRGATLSAAAEAVLLAHDWPGNIRELENIMQRALILAAGGIIEPNHLLLPAAPRNIEASRQNLPQAGAPTRRHDAGARPADMKSLERQHILDTLAAVGGSRKKAAEQLGMSERTLRYKLQQYRQEDAGT